MTDACCSQLLKVAPHYKGAPVTQHSVPVDIRLQQLSIGPLIHNLVLQISNIDCLKEHWGDPGLKKKPASKINSSDNVIITACRWKLYCNGYKDEFYLLFVLSLHYKPTWMQKVFCTSFWFKCKCWLILWILNYANHSMKQINWALDNIWHHCLDSLHNITNSLQLFVLWRTNK